MHQRNEVALKQIKTCLKWWRLYRKEGRKINVSWRKVEKKKVSDVGQKYMFRNFNNSTAHKEIS